MRGAVSLSLALIVSASSKIDPYIKNVILLHTAGIALMTLMVNATTASFVIKKLGLQKQSEIKIRVLVDLLT